MIRKLITRVMQLKAIPTSTIKLIGIILGVFVGGSYMIKGNSFFQSVTNNYIYSEENSQKTTDDSIPRKETKAIDNQTLTQKTNTKQTNISTPNITKPNTNAKSKPTTSESTKKTGLFSESSLKNASKKNVSLFITTNGTIDFKTSRAVSSSAKGVNLNFPSLFNNGNLKYFNDFMSPSMAFLKTHNVNNYTDYYFICDISRLDPQKNSGMDTYRSTLNIEGYIINTQNSKVIKFPYDNIKGVGFNSNDAINNMNKDLQEKITTFIKNNI
ncbi:hypothetical protein HNV08_02665 [Winogradskyella eckloniae]|uniref:hypothetical protein n=1 Tax=Winogradskyella eckloniae TaxID=1089306 RepID=UPI00156459C9|nr:hypothetical protein [Winogradskyella eckloniae]NRD18937.1 hypothetical protein [Winogradskyella eckloniae]